MNALTTLITTILGTFAYNKVDRSDCVILKIFNLDVSKDIDILGVINIREFAGFSRIYVTAEENSQVYSSLTFICVDGTVMPLANVCDGIPHCPDSSDEVGTLCHHVV